MSFQHPTGMSPAQMAFALAEEFGGDFLKVQEYCTEQLAYSLNEEEREYWRAVLAALPLPRR